MSESALEGSSRPGNSQATSFQWPRGVPEGWLACTASMSASTTCSICARMCANAISRFVRSLCTA